MKEIKINSSLKQYIQDEILPRYKTYDKAHQIDHIQQVIDRSLELASNYDVDINIVYAIAAYHDLGLCQGRTLHHIYSGEILINDSYLTNWFSPDQLLLMQQAVEDHRASNKSCPRSIYGKIVAEADRLIVPQTIIRRTIQYGISNCLDLSFEEQFIRFYTHLQEKYDYNGYLQLWLPESENHQKLEELRRLIAQKEKLFQIFTTIWKEERTA